MIVTIFRSFKNIAIAEYWFGKTSMNYVFWLLNNMQNDIA